MDLYESLKNFSTPSFNILFHNLTNKSPLVNSIISLVIVGTRQECIYRRNEVTPFKIFSTFAINMNNVRSV